jgi:glycerol-3-phosphate dehydrogenase
MQPLELILPYVPSMRPLWMIKIGLWLYDRLGGKSSLPRSRVLDLHASRYGEGVDKAYNKGFSYYDGSVDDARLVVLNAVDAAAKGAEIITYDECVSLVKDGDVWQAKTKAGKQIHARVVVNAAGPWVQKLLHQNEVGKTCAEALRLVQGSHIVVPKLYDGEHAFILQEEDGRIVFVWPYYGYSAVGTTDLDIGKDPDIEVKITQGETDYLLNIINKYFEQQTSAEDIVSSWAGVRALADDDGKSAKAASRDYKFKWCADILSVYGGKITTYRVLAKQASQQVCKALGRIYKEWTHEAHLPGGALNETQDIKSFIDAQWQKYPWMPQGLLVRMARNYGTVMDDILEGVSDLKGLGEHFGGGLYAREVDYLRTLEFAITAEDILWRRSKLGLLKDEDMRLKLSQYLKKQG